MSPKFAAASDTAIPVDVISTEGFAHFTEHAPKTTVAWAKANGFAGKLGQVLTVPGEGGLGRVLVGWGTLQQRKRDRLHMGAVVAQLPEGTYHIASGLDGAEKTQAALAWLLGGYVFDRYKKKAVPKAALVAPEGVDATRLEAIAAGDFLTRDLINTPASDMGPDGLEAAFMKLAQFYKAKTEVIRGNDLLAQNFPMIHTVGRASDQAPRLLDMIWGDENAPKITLVGKGVCFDTGGLNIKPAGSMGLMKKDMGGAATVLGLAKMIMELNLPLRLRVLVPAVENSISAGAYRPQDILTSRKGLSVEINNTDAEGRLVLADALTLADEEEPDLLVCKATLTGAARVALGPDLMPFYTEDDTLAQQMSANGAKVEDPLWRMPFWDAYEPTIEPDVADLDNAPKGGFGGSITAALFLRRFVEHTDRFVHLDIYGWTPAAKPARTLGGACQSARAMLEVIEQRVTK
ncbi:leucyl aminopeptidase family protein [Neptunicoccus cionae]|uniref:Leucyl aminopeptidase n=1 Tax=Neptunicoccus cionae TaxID=2035344 RepID=A0A916QXU8_9RHOB|nr:leucyl aminopeptidase family protein [Amylibacter cionae]GGA19505.1 leucyl aminopeptidase [Amylibacter cionae]